MPLRITILAALLLSWLILATSGQALAQTWTTKAPMPTPRGSLAVGVVNGILYAVGGDNGITQLATVEAYDPATNTWTTKAPMPTPRSGLAVGVVNGILYAVGGKLGAGFCCVLATIEAYNPATNTWTTKAPMPTPRQHLSVGVANGILYALEGANAPGNSPIAAVEAYDPLTNTWTSKALPPIAAFAQGVGVVGGTLYAVGGADGATCFNANQAYDAANNTWTVKAPTTNRAFPGAGVINGILYVVGGGDCAVLLASGVAYDPTMDTWTAIPPMPGGGRYTLGAGVVNGVLYAVGGSSAVASLATNEAFTPITLACAGFDSPFDVSILIKAKVQRAIPLKMQLSESGTPITDLNIPGAAPVVDVSYSAGGGPAVDVTGLLEPVGQSSDGNTFSFDAGTGRWVFNLGTKQFSAAGTYTVTAKAGDTSYAISPSCSGEFVRGN